MTVQILDVPEHDIDVRIFHDEMTSFHPKSYIFRSADGSAATAFVGSSNLSASGISGGIEWNLGVEEIGALVSAFERLWADNRTLPLAHDWLRAYRERPRISPVGVVPEPPVQPTEPWPIQREALDALEGDQGGGPSRGPRRHGYRARQDLARGLRRDAAGVPADPLRRPP